LSCAAIVAPPWLLVLIQPDLGECLVQLPMILALLFVGRIPKRYLLVMIVCGLALVPVVANAHDKTTRELAECVARLIRDARAGTLKPAELAGSTFTVSNFGALGLDDGVPVINYPEAAILGMGSLKPRPMVLDDTVVVRPQMTLTCVFDHRVADGANVAQFLGELRRLIESPETALLDL